jgi:hypothetical protein
LIGTDQKSQSHNNGREFAGCGGVFSSEIIPSAGVHLLPAVSLHGMVEYFEDGIEEESELALMAQFLSDETLHSLTGGTTALISQ